MLHYQFNADLREVLRRLAAAAQNGNSQNKSLDEQGSVPCFAVGQPLSRNSKRCAS